MFGFNRQMDWQGQQPPDWATIGQNPQQQQPQWGYQQAMQQHQPSWVNAQQQQGWQALQSPQNNGTAPQYQRQPNAIGAAPAGTSLQDILRGQQLGLMQTRGIVDGGTSVWDAMTKAREQQNQVPTKTPEQIRLENAQQMFVGSGGTTQGAQGGGRSGNKSSGKSSDGRSSGGNGKGGR